ncbi:MAG TPA: 2-dehydro-3-deoxygalactonokinase [Vicinamibacteria bacterium]|nr:2-dehydro-3-deoxygalactonokinase [Vicinamibacteria bacterium]
MGRSLESARRPTLLAVDAGTTNTRVWLVGEEGVLVRRDVGVGARDTSRDGNNARLRAALRALIGDVLRAAPPDRPAPQRIAAAGMITSAQGLVEVAHVPAPAGLAEISAHAHEALVADVSDRPFLFVPGVRTEARPGAPEGVGATDVMRGEETLCLGLLRQGRLERGGLLLNVGSHWKLIRVDEEGRVAWSLTSLSGEMMQAVRTQTVLASAVPEGTASAVDPHWVREGLAEARRAGLARALFCVRLLEIAGESSAAARHAFLLGAFIGADLDRLQATSALPPGAPISVAGDEKTGGAWSAALSEADHPVRRLSAEDVEAGFLSGLRAVAEAHAAHGTPGIDTASNR